jgi:glutaredoxin-like protein NrdH
MPLIPIVVWELPNCVQCNQTKKELDKRGIVYKTKRLDKSPKAVERFKELGLLQAPIVETDLKRWSGFRLDKIKSLDYHIKSERAQGINIPKEPLKQIAEEVEDGHS